jgi:hypothetical protein
MDETYPSEQKKNVVYSEPLQDHDFGDHPGCDQHCRNREHDPSHYHEAITNVVIRWKGSRQRPIRQIDALKHAAHVGGNGM